MTDDFHLIPLADLVEPWIVLRAVNRTSLAYLELRDSLRSTGFLNSICVRSSAKYPDKYEVVDGLYRFTAAKELGLSVVPCVVKSHLSDEDVLAMQVQANALRPETTPVEYARQLKRIMQAMSQRLGRDIRMDELARRVYRAPNWVSEQLGLLNLTLELQKAVDRGEIQLRSAYMLARVPRSQQAKFTDAARTLSAKEFTTLVGDYIRRLKDAVVQGRLAPFFEEFKPRPYLRLLKEILAEYENRQLGSTLLAAANCTTAVDGWYHALQWVAHLDEASVKKDRAVVEQRQQRAIVERLNDSE